MTDTNVQSLDTIDSPLSIPCLILLRIMDEAKKHTNKLIDVHTMCMMWDKKINQMICEDISIIQNFVDTITLYFPCVLSGTEVISITWDIFDFSIQNIQLMTNINKMREVISVLELICEWEKNIDLNKVKEMEKYISNSIKCLGEIKFEYEIKESDGDSHLKIKRLNSIGNLIRPYLNPNAWPKRQIPEVIGNHVDKMRCLIDAFRRINDELGCVKQLFNDEFIYRLNKAMKRIQQRIEIISEGHTQALSLAQSVHNLVTFVNGK